MTSVKKNNEELLITDILVQKKEPTRRSIFINGKFSFGVSYDTFGKYNLKKGDRLLKSQKKEIIDFENYFIAKGFALKYLSSRMRTSWEVRNYLLRTDISEDIIDRILSDFIDKKYIDDDTYTRAFIRDQLKFNKIGLNKIRDKLYQKHINPEMIDNIFNDEITDEDQKELALKLAYKKIKVLQNKDKKREKTYKYLIQKGFQNNIVIEIINQIQELNN